MKKTISILLALLMVISLPISMSLSASAAGTFSLELQLPAGKTSDDLWLIYDEEAYPDLSAIAANTVFKFTVGLHDKYNPAHTQIYANDVIQTPTSDGLYGILMDQNIIITLPSNGGQNFLLKTYRFDMLEARGEGFVTRPRDSWNEIIAPYWGETVQFKIELKEGFRGSFDYDNPEKSKLLVKLIDAATREETTLIMKTQANGGNIVEPIKTAKEYIKDGPLVESDGRRYKLVATELVFESTPIYGNTRVLVAGVLSDSAANTLNWFVRIIRLLVNLFTGNAAASDFDGLITDTNMIDKIIQMFSIFSGM